MRKWAVVGLTAMLFVLATAVAAASNSWSIYHWKDDNLTPTVADRTSSSLYDVQGSVGDWGALGASIQPAMSAKKNGAIVVVEGR